MNLDKNVPHAEESFKRIDFHAHILPKLDHGSNSTAQSVQQMQMLLGARVDTVCSTSHFYPNSDIVADFLERRDNALQRLEDALGGAPRPKMVLGAEVLICDRLEEMVGLERLCLEGTNILLLELPLGISHLTQSHYDTVMSISEMGIVPVLAHAERYREHCIDPLVKAGVQVQINAAAFTRLFRSKYVEGLVRDGTVVAVGSDYHFNEAQGLACFDKLCIKRPELAKEIFARSEELLASAVKR